MIGTGRAGLAGDETLAQLDVGLAWWFRKYAREHGGLYVDP
jgi:hypothetical protein